MEKKNKSVELFLSKSEVIPFIRQNQLPNFEVSSGLDPRNRLQISRREYKFIRVKLKPDSVGTESIEFDSPVKSLRSTDIVRRYRSIRISSRRVCTRSENRVSYLFAFPIPAQAPPEPDPAQIKPDSRRRCKMATSPEFLSKQRSVLRVFIFQKKTNLSKISLREIPYPSYLSTKDKN